MIHSRKVVEITRIPVKSILSYKIYSDNIAVISSYSSFDKLKIKVPADLTLSDKVTDNVRLYTAKLTFLFCGQSYNKDRSVYILKLANGKKLLIGSNMRPYPTIETNQNISSSDSNSELIEVTVNYTSTSDIGQMVKNCLLDLI